MKERLVPLPLDTQNPVTDGQENPLTTSEILTHGRIGAPVLFTLAADGPREVLEQLYRLRIVSQETMQLKTYVIPKRYIDPVHYDNPHIDLYVDHIGGHPRARILLEESIPTRLIIDFANLCETE